MSLEVHVSLNTAPIRRFAERFPQRLRLAMRGALQAVGRDMVGKAKQYAPADSGGLRRGMDSAILETPDAISAIVFNRLRYSLFVHGGAKYTNKMPPPRALVQWARRHLLNRRISHQRAQSEAAGISFRPKKVRTSEDEALSLAWAVAKSIKRRGFLPARPFLRDAFHARKSHAESLIRTALADAMSDAVN